MWNVNVNEMQMRQEASGVSVPSETHQMQTLAGMQVGGVGPTGQLPDEHDKASFMCVCVLPINQCDFHVSFSAALHLHLHVNLQLQLPLTLLHFLM